MSHYFVEVPPRSEDDSSVTLVTSTERCLGRLGLIGEICRSFCTFSYINFFFMMNFGSLTSLRADISLSVLLSEASSLKVGTKV